MPTAPGTFLRIDSNRFAAQFVIDGILYTFSATFSPSVQPFASNAAKIDYHSIDFLTSTRSYGGRIGINDFNLTLDNGVELSGQLNPPGVNPTSSVNGTGTWEQY